MNDLAALLLHSRQTSWSNYGRRIRFYAPSFTRYQNKSYSAPVNAFPSISITGDSCGLGCKHCQGKLLQTMIPALTPKDLLQVSRDLSSKGCRGCLISGGCLPDGSVPLQPFIETLKQIKRETKLTIAVHTGIIKAETARQLADAGVDEVLIDIIGSDETIRDVYRLNTTVRDYETSLESLEAANMVFIPHVIVGLHYGRLLGEQTALEMISRHNPQGLVVIALIPIRGTPMETSSPPIPEDIARVIAYARMKMPKTPIALGCMRPVGAHRAATDMLAIDAGINGIAFPSEEGIQHAEALGLSTSFSPSCCCQVFEDFRKGFLESDHQ